MSSDHARTNHLLRNRNLIVTFLVCVGIYVLGSGPLTALAISGQLPTKIAAYVIGLYRPLAYAAGHCGLLGVLLEYVNVCYNFFEAL